jgi:hypothetical protein
VISENDIARIQDQLGRLSIQAVEIDLDGFLEVTEFIGSPQALSHGFGIDLVNSASQWAERARILKPFRDHIIEQSESIREELAEREGGLAPRKAACPGCQERRVDRLSTNEDDSVVCATCGRRYQLSAVERTDIVVCECSPAINSTCATGPHGEGHDDEAFWRVSQADDPDEFFYLCGPCKESLETAPDAAALRFVLIAEEDADTGA